MSQQNWSAVPPPHVPSALVRPFDFALAPGMNESPHAAFARLHEGPRIFWTPVEHWFAAGAWVPTRYEDIRDILTDPKIFSATRSVRFSALVGDDWDLIPSEIDPPLHGKYRSLLTPLFGPARMRALEDRIRDHAIALIGDFSEKHGCEFMSEFARPFPILLFLELMGLPKNNFQNFVVWGADLLHGADMAARCRGAASIKAYLQAEIEDRKQNAREDILSYLVNVKLDDRKLDDRELLGIAFLLFGGGVDTVTSSLGFYFRYLAEHPEVQAMLRSDPSRVANAVEEFLRMFAIVTVNRHVTEDVEFAGVSMKRGDWVLVSTALGSLDPDQFAAPLQADFARKSQSHATFSMGPHFCLGAHLARRELTIGIQEWLRLMPDFRIAEDATVQVHGGPLMGVDRLPLAWDAARDPRR